MVYILLLASPSCRVECESEVQPDFALTLCSNRRRPSSWNKRLVMCKPCLRTASNPNPIEAALAREDYEMVISQVREAMTTDPMAALADPTISQWIGRRYRNIFIDEAVTNPEALKHSQRTFPQMKERFGVKILASDSHPVRSSEANVADLAAAIELGIGTASESRRSTSPGPPR